MAFRNRNEKRPRPTGPRMNGNIRISPVRVVLGDGTQLGVMPTDEAREKADELGMDLVEIQPNVRPPVCKIIDYGKFKYDEKKKKNEQKKKQSRIELKQIKMRPKTDEHDFGFKVKNARKFLEDGNKVQFEVRFRGRENAHPETGKAILDRAMKELADIAKPERIPRYENRQMIMIIAPK
jgi:translation initiation factor IF-3